MVWLTKEEEGEVGEGNEAGKVRSPNRYTASLIWMMRSSLSTMGRNKIPICTPTTGKITKTHIIMTHI